MIDPLTTLSDQPYDFLPLTPACFSGQHLSLNIPVSLLHEKRDLRKDFLYNTFFNQKFWSCLMKSYLPTHHYRGKWRNVYENFTVWLLVLVGSAKNLPKRKVYRLGRIHCLHPQVRMERYIVKLAMVAVFAKNPDSGITEIKYTLRDLSKLPEFKEVCSLFCVLFLSDCPFIAFFCIFFSLPCNYTVFVFFQN